MTRPTHPPLAAPTLSERDWQQLVVDVARLHRWDVYHTYDSRRSPAGFPDLLLTRPPELMFVELKTATGKVTAPQLAFLDRLERCHLEVHVWRPQDEERAFARLARTPTMESAT